MRYSELCETSEPSSPEEVGHRHRPPGRGDEVEDRPALLGVALPDAGETALGGGVQLVAISAAASRSRHVGTRSPYRRMDRTTSHGGVQLWHPEVRPRPNPMNRFLEHLDRLQRRHHWMALPLAVFKRFGEHGGGRLATTVSYWSFFSIFPLLLVFVTVLNLVLEDNPERRQDLVDGALGQVPVIGTELADSQTALAGSWTTVVIGLLVALWAGLAAANALQDAVEEIWDTPPFERPNPAVKRLRSILFLVILAVGIFASTAGVDLAVPRRSRRLRRRGRDRRLVRRQRVDPPGHVLRCSSAGATRCANCSQVSSSPPPPSSPCRRWDRGS